MVFEKVNLTLHGIFELKQFFFFVLFDIVFCNFSLFFKSLPNDKH